jgi:hypothetical protein
VLFTVLGKIADICEAVSIKSEKQHSVQGRRPQWARAVPGGIESRTLAKLSAVIPTKADPVISSAAEYWIPAFVGDDTEVIDTGNSHNPP